MSTKITQYLLTSMKRSHTDASRAIDKEISLWSKRKHLKKYHHDIDAMEKTIEGMIDNLVNKND